MSNSSDPLLVVEGISMSFDGKWALRDVDLTIPKGHIHGLIGHNGSGKSTLVRILAGYHHQVAGTVRLGEDELPPGSPARRGALGLRFVHQELGLVPQFDALENFGLGGRYDRTRWRTIDWGAQRRRLVEVMQLLNTDIPVDVPVSELSAVQRSLIAIARAIGAGSGAQTARLLVLDEPTTTLEGPETEQLFRVVRTLADSGIGVLYISHHLSDVIDLCGDVTVLRDGRVVEEFSTAGATRAKLVSALLGPAENLDPAASAPTDDLVAAPTLDRDVPAYAVRNLRSVLLSGLDFEIFPGECVCVLGLTGSGREELAYASAGAVAAQADNVAVDGKEVAVLDPRACHDLGIALVPGNRLPGSLVAEFNLRENLSFAALDQNVKRVGYVDRRKEMEAARDWIKRFDIRPGDPGFIARHMSGGNKQKMILAKWLSIEPSVMIIDEPTAGVDVGAAKALLGTLRSVADSGAALLVSTSEIDDALAIADRILILHEGKVRAELRRGADELTEETVMLSMAGHDESDESAVAVGLGGNNDEGKGAR